jgi:hypothetical protein
MLLKWGVRGLGILPLVSTIAHGACLPTLGTDNCSRGEDPVVQAIEHRYLDAPAPAEKVRHHKKVVHKDSSDGSGKPEHSDKGGGDKGSAGAGDKGRGGGGRIRAVAAEVENRIPSRRHWKPFVALSVSVEVFSGHHHFAGSEFL